MDGLVHDLDIKEESTLSKRIPEFLDYVVLREEGSGGYGTVYRVKRKNDDQLFAIKCPLEKTTREYVNHEIKMLQKVGGQEYITRCEEVVQEVLHVDMEEELKTNQRPNLVLPYIEHDKPEVLRKEINIQELKMYGYCLFKALAFLHKQGIVHRDVKPGNFLFSRIRGTGYLVDFNLALETSTLALTSGKYNTTIFKPTKNHTQDFQLAPSKNTLGKRARKDIELKTSKRHQKFNKQESLIESPCKNKSLGSLTLARSTSIHVEDCPKKSTLLDFDLKDSIFDPFVQAQRLRQSRQFLKPFATPKEPHNGYPLQSMLGNRPSMSPTIGVLRFAQYLKNRNPTITLVTSIVPPASERKRIAAIQDKKTTTIQLPSSSPRPNTKGARIRRHLDLGKDGPCAGTKGYRAPEVLLKSNLQTSKLDVWSAGVSLLQLIAGKAPFPSSSSEQALRDVAKFRGVDELLKLAGGHDCLHKLPPAFETLNYKPMAVTDWCSAHARRCEMRDQFPADVCDLLEKCLQVDPKMRIEASEALSHEFFKSVEERVVHDPGFSPPDRNINELIESAAH